jgi:hypothetical protein
VKETSFQLKVTSGQWQANEKNNKVIRHKVTVNDISLLQYVVTHQ